MNNARRINKRSIKEKLWLAMSSIAVILLLSSVISIFEYKRMSSYVSDLVAGDMNCINSSQRLSVVCERYNLKILSAVGEADTTTVVNFDLRKEIDQCDMAAASLDSLRCPVELTEAYNAYISVSKELERAITSDFIDTRAWYFNSLQPKFEVLNDLLQSYNSSVHTDLKDKSEEFKAGFYRCILPGIVAVGAGLLLIILLMVFISSYYVNPIYKMLRGLDAYNNASVRRYNVSFDGDDELNELNKAITDAVEENIELKRRLKDIKNRE